MAATEIIVSTIFAIILIPVSALVLWLVTKLFKTKEKGFVLALKTAAVASVIMFIIKQGLAAALGVSAGASAIANPATLLATAGLFLLLIIAASLIVNTFAVKRFYKQETMKAFLIGLAWWAIYLAVYTIAAMILGAILVAAIIGTGAAYY